MSLFAGTGTWPLGVSAQQYTTLAAEKQMIAEVNKRALHSLMNCCRLESGFGRHFGLAWKRLWAGPPSLSSFQADACSLWRVC
jgi:hypothetical protein